MDASPIEYGNPFLSDFTLTICVAEHCDISIIEGTGETNSKRQRITSVDIVLGHGLILCKAKYFHANLQRWHEAGKREIQLTVNSTAEAGSLLLMIQYLYSGSLPSDMEQWQLMQLLVTADSFTCCSCLRHCQQVLLSAARGNFQKSAIDFLYTLPTSLYEHSTSPLYAVKEAVEQQVREAWMLPPKGGLSAVNKMMI